MRGIGRQLWLLLAAAGAAEAFQVPSHYVREGRITGVSTARLPASSPQSVRRAPAISTLHAGLLDNIFGGGGAKAGVQAEEKKPEWTELIDEASGKPCEYEDLAYVIALTYYAG